MPKFAANLTTMFTEAPLLDRFNAARRAGFDAVEVLFPYEHAARELADRLIGNDLKLVLINGPPPNYTERPRGFAAVPGGSALFQQDLVRAVRYAKALDATHLHLMAGVAEGADARDTMIANLKWAAAEAPGQSLTIEPINPISMPGYFLNDFDLAMDILDAVDAPNVGLQFDAFHAHKITGDVFGTWSNVRHRVVHVQVAGLPDRHEPVKGEVDYPKFFKLLDDDGYEGWVSGEYHPAKRTEDGLKWIS
ncbi:hydroxypyruvate isomerase family protein [Flavimaricola marinus]|uniref:Putative hydroxypyruvate isomerase YgbM n=1 Tax=Flavimaricola marinus TaxID=1819565 RepID=A0A238LB37_9RHOB|nr:TIM barrel protein [Flavimaricola marinus]SMY06186.1 Putative hydroxypyruvate isomerase YgbM [Flavimaricola marinus]